MGGDLSLSSTVGKGTCFQFDIYVQAVQAPETQIARLKRRVVGLKPGQPVYRLLVVEDIEINRKLLVMLLQPLGFEIREATNGQEAITIWKEWEPHLIWMDMRMPVMDGREATKYIKATPQGQDTIIVALTASAFEEDRAAALAVGCDDFVRKPFREAAIFDILTKHIGVHFVYEELGVEDQGSGIGEESAARVLDLARLPAAWLADLHQATTEGDSDWMVTLIEQIQEQNPALAGALTQLAANFEHNQILALIQQATKKPAGRTTDSYNSRSATGTD
jgi:CheY-like chemotaxis protein